MKLAILCPPEIPIPPVGYSGIERICSDIGEELALNSARWGIDSFTIFCTPAQDAPPYTSPYPGDLRSAVESTDLTIDFTHAKVGKEFGSRSNYIAACLLTDSRSYVNDVYLSKAVRDGFKDPAGKVVYAGLRPEKYSSMETRDKSVLFLGRMSSIKRPDIAIVAASRAKVPLVLAGHFGSYAMHPSPHFPQMVRDEAKRKGFLVVEEPSEERKRELLAHTSAVIVPSDWSSLGSGAVESFGLVALEALMSGARVITSGEGGLKEIITPETGTIANSMDEYVTAIRDAIEHPDPVACVKRGREFSTAVMLDNLVAYWKESQ